MVGIYFLRKPSRSGVDKSNILSDEYIDSRICGSYMIVGFQEVNINLNSGKLIFVWRRGTGEWLCYPSKSLPAREDVPLFAI